MNNDIVRWIRIHAFEKHHTDTKCICGARIYTETVCTKCQFDNLPMTEQNKLRELAYKLDLANLRLAIKGYSAENPYVSLSVNTFKG